MRREQVGNKTRMRATGKINGGGERIELLRGRRRHLHLRAKHHADTARESEVVHRCTARPYDAPCVRRWRQTAISIDYRTAAGRAGGRHRRGARGVRGEHQRDPPAQSRRVPVVLPAFAVARARRSRRVRSPASRSFAKGAGAQWPDLIEANDIHLTPLQPGIVYGTYRYRVRYGSRRACRHLRAPVRQDSRRLEDRASPARSIARRHAASAARAHRRDADRRPRRRADSRTRSDPARRQDRLRRNRARSARSPREST